MLRLLYMKLWVSIFLILTTGILLNAQNIISDTDSLSKYSYRIGTTSILGARCSTGFFLAGLNNRLYLVSCHHVLTGRKYNDSLIALTFDVSVEMPKKGFMNIPINTDSILFINPPDSLNKKPDLLIYEVTGIINDHVNTINQFLFFENPSILDSVFSFGYGVNNRDIQCFSTIKKVDGFVNVQIGDTAFYAGGKVIDKFNYFVKGKSMGGSSGSPAFLKRNNKILFAGVMVGGFDNENFSLILKPSVFYEELKKQLKNTLMNELP